MIKHPCDICGNKQAVEVPHARVYTNDQPLHICTDCGFVYVKNRRPASEIAKAWSDIIFSDKVDDGQYTARIPAVKARQVFVADFADVHLQLKGKRLCDIGAGEGQFLEIARKDYGAEVFGVEPSAKNTKEMKANGIDCFCGTAEDFEASDQFEEGKFDVVTMMWTLVNSYSCNKMVEIANRMLKEGGHIVVAEGSRLLVPFKKPMSFFLSTMPADLHPFQFSVNSLGNLLKLSKFHIKATSRYIDSDVLCLIGQKSSKKVPGPIVKDDYLKVADFFERWHTDTQMHYAQEKNT